MVHRVHVQPSPSPRKQQASRPSILSRAKHKAISTWTRSLIGHRSEYSVERLLAFRDYYQRASFGRVIAVCFLTPIPALLVTLAIDLIPLTPPSQGWQENYALWVRLFISTFAISLGLIAQIKEVITAQTISTIGTFKVAVATSFSYVGVTIIIASLWRFPIPFGYVLLVGPYVTIFSFFIVMEIGPRVLTHSTILRQQIKSQLMIVATQGVVAVAYPLFSAVFNHLTGIEQTAFIIVMPIIKFVTKQIIAGAAKRLNEFVGPIVVFSVDVFNVFYVAICMQAATSTMTTLLIVAADSFHVIVAVRSIFQRNNANHGSRGSELSYYLSELPLKVQMVFQGFAPHVRQIRIRAPFPLPLSDESRVLLGNLNKLKNSDAQTEIESISTRYSDQNMTTQGDKYECIQLVQPIRTIAVAKPRQIEPSCPITEGYLVKNKTDHLKSVYDDLQALFHSEYVLMGEYIEFVLPLLYALYLAVLFHLPIAAYYPHTSTMTTTKLHETLVSILAFSVVEFVAFSGLLLMLRRKFGFTPLYQLAFVLETQANTLQGHLFVWTPFILQLTLVHYGTYYFFMIVLPELMRLFAPPGVDFSFHFA